MKNKNIWKMSLREEYEMVVTWYVIRFCKKHGFQFDYWIGDAVGEVGQFGDYFIDFRDIKLDTDNRVNKDHFIKWYDESLKNALEHAFPWPNYRTYLMGEGVKLKP